MVFIPLFSIATPIKVKCEFKISGWRFIDDDAYKCFVSDLLVETANTIIDDTEGEHLEGKTNNDVKAVDIYKQQCHFFPKGLDKVFKNIEALSVSNSELRSLNKKDLRPFTNLKLIWFFSNKLTVIEPNLFVYNSKLKFVDFGNNRIRSVAIDLFDPLVELEKVMFNANICITRDGEGRSQIKDIEREIFRNCQNEVEPIKEPEVEKKSEGQCICENDPEILEAISTMKEEIKKLQVTLLDRTKYWKHYSI